MTADMGHRDVAASLHWCCEDTRGPPRPVPPTHRPIRTDTKQRTAWLRLQSLAVWQRAAAVAATSREKATLRQTHPQRGPRRGASGGTLFQQTT